jgi:hypothetical protein
MSVGQQFASLRAAKALTPEQASADIVSASKLLAFENDRSDIPLTKFTQILLGMGYTLRQFASYCDRLAINKNTLCREIGNAYAVGDTQRLLKLYEMVNNNAATQDDVFLSRMTAAGYYYELTGKKLVTAADEARLADDLLKIVSWDESEVDALIATVPLLNSSRLFTVSREVMRLAPSLREWNYSLYVGTWTAVMRGLKLLIERRSTFAAALLRQIDDTQEMAEGMIQNRFKLRYLRLVMQLSKKPDELLRRQIRAEYNMILPLAPVQLLNGLRDVSIKAAEFDPAAVGD